MGGGVLAVKAGETRATLWKAMLVVVCLLRGVRFALEIEFKAVKAVGDAPKLKYL